jgi:hypothetical protein
MFTGLAILLLHVVGAGVLTAWTIRRLGQMWGRS